MGGGWELERRRNGKGKGMGGLKCKGGKDDDDMK